MKRILEKKFRKIIILEDEMLQTLNDIIENFNYVINPNCNKEDILAFQVLDYVLMTMPGAVLKQKIIDVF